MNKGAKINAFLLSIGFAAEIAYTEAKRLEGLSGKVTKAPTKKASIPGSGLLSEAGLEDRMRAYAVSRNGNVWSLSSLAAHLPGTNRNYISSILTGWVKNGTVNRTGRGEYVFNRKARK